MTSEELHLVCGGLILGGVVLLVFWFYRHQCLLAERANMMRESIRNRDFTFRLPSKRLFFGERALQDTVNNLSQDISALVAQNEVESWQRLTRVLTHEIMNGIAPICSISQAYLSNPNITNSPFEEGIRAIHQTSQGMANFVQNFRKITSIQEPVMNLVNLMDIATSMRELYPSLTWNINDNLDRNINADEGMLRQVLTNLIKNAIEAGATGIDLRYQHSLCISNDGTPIPDDVAQDIFIPFFTTKKTGSGIGLSLSRQMMIKQGMNLFLASRPVPGYHTTFEIR